MTKAAKARTVAQVNKALRSQIHPYLLLVKGDGYFWVTATDDDEELGLRLAALDHTSIYINALNQLTVQEWVSEVQKIFDQIDWERTRLVCKDCKHEIFADVNMVMIKKELWLSIADQEEDALCDKCMEKRLGRKITEEDFGPDYADALCNKWWLQEQKGEEKSDDIGDWERQMMDEYGWYAHYIPSGDDQTSTGTNFHTHGIEQSLDHPDIQIVFPLPMETNMYIAQQIVEMIKRGHRLEVGGEYDVLDNGYKVRILQAKEDGRDVLRVCIPDKNHEYKANSAFAKQLITEPGIVINLNV